MSTVERVTVSLPPRVRQQAQRLAEAEDLSFSSVVTSALEDWTRGRLLDEWIRDYETEFGAFTEDELKDIAARTGMPYLQPVHR